MLVEKYRKFVYGRAFHYTKSDVDADDLAQEVFIKMFEHLHTFKFESSLQTWLYTIVKNTFLNMKSKRNIENVYRKLENIDSENESNPEYLDNFAVDNIDPEKHLEYEEFKEKFEKALNELPDRQREVFCLRYFDEMKYEDMSKLLNLTEGGLKANYSIAIKKLAKKLLTDNENL